MTTDRFVGDGNRRPMNRQMKTSKKCSNCNIEKSLEDFNKKKDSPDGRRSRCRECQKSESAKYVNGNRDLINEKSRAGYVARKQRNILALEKKICSKCGIEKIISEFHKKADSHDGLLGRCKSCYKIERKLYRDAIPDRIKQWHRNYIDKDINKSREIWKKASRKYKNSNRDILVKKERLARAINPEYFRQKTKKWQGNNPEKVRLNRHKRRSRIESSDSNYNPEDIIRIYENQSERCFYCHKSITWPEKGTHIDHKIPLSRGGSNEASNICLSCSRCNTSKGYKTVEEFLSGTYVPRSVLV